MLVAGTLPTRRLETIEQMAKRLLVPVNALVDTGVRTPT
jgi:hypothetical protein